MRRLLSHSTSSPAHRFRALGLIGITFGVLTLSPLQMADSMAQENAKPAANQAQEQTKSSEANAPSPPDEAATKTDTSEKGAQRSAEPAKPDLAIKKEEACLIAPPERQAIVTRIKKMRPKSAAKLFVALPPELAADLLLRIDARQSARIMNELPPHTSATLVTILSNDDASPSPLAASAPEANGSATR